MTVRVMIVEDEPYIVESLEFLLSRDGFRVTSQSDGDQAMRDILNDPPDVLVLDAMLPGRSGFDILREVRNTPAVQSLPVLMLTAKGQQSAAEDAKKSGVSLFMTKPFSNAELVDAVRRLAS